MLEKIFPGLRGTAWAETSPQDVRYNCIAWAARDKTRYWWPNPQYYWPTGVPMETTVAAFVEAFGTLGYSMSRTADQEPGKEKIAIFADGDEPKHAARQMGSGMWTSKLGPNIDIAHELEGLQGKEYGDVAVILERSRGHGERPNQRRAVR